jgi:putative peptidoglycan lipid II flippase
LSETGKRVAKAAVLLMVTIIISRILGYAREVVLYSLFGQAYITDAYRAAFSIPDFLYMLLVGGALSSAFIPVFSSCIVSGKEQDGWKSASIVFNYVLIFLILLVCIAYFYTLPLVNLLAPGLPPEYIALTVQLTRIMFLQTGFMVLNGFAMGILNSFNNFAAPAIGSLVYNLVIIIVGVLLQEQYGITAFAIGVVVGSALNFAVQIPALKKVGLKYYPSFNLKDKGFNQIMVLMIPVLAGLGVVQLNLFVTRNLASGLGAGAISALDLAQRLMNLPMGIFAVAIATAIFPTLTTLVANGEIAMFKRSTSLGLRAIFLVSIPASFGMAALGVHMISLLFEQGKFTGSMVDTTYRVLVFYLLGLFAYSGIQVLNRSFYALKDTLTPVVASAITIAANIVLSILLARTMGAEGLALAYSLAGILNLFLLIVVLRYKVGRMDGSALVRGFMVSTGASIAMYFTVQQVVKLLYGVFDLLEKINLIISVGAGIVAGVVVYAALVYMFKLEETELVVNMVKRKLKRGNGNL